MPKVRDFMVALIIQVCMHEKESIKKNVLLWSQHFPHNPMRAICYHGNQSSNPIWLKPYQSFCSTRMMLQMKFDCHWSSGLRYIHIRKCEHKDEIMHARTPERVPSYELAL